MIIELELFLKGFAIGLAVALPIGPLNILCITRTLRSGFGAGVPVMVGTGLADATYAAVAVFGLTIISDLLISWQFWLKTAGALVLLYLGIKTLRATPHVDDGKKVGRISFIKDVSLIYGITISSPMTIMTFVALFAGLGMEMFTSAGLNGYLMVLGVFSGTFSWMLLLTFISTVVRTKLDDSFLQKLNRVGGVILIGFAVALIIGF